MKNKINSICAVGFLILITMACNFSVSTANLSDIKFGKDKTAGSPSTSFKPQDEIFVVTAVNNSGGGKNKVKFRVLYDKVDGAPSGTVAYKIEKELPVENDGAVSFNFSVPTGIAPGSYKSEVVLAGEEGKEFDRKTAGFTVTGDGANKTTKSDAPPAGDDENKDSDDK